MISKIKKPVSILLSLIMVFSLFTIVPLSASAAVGDYVPESDYLTFTAEEANSSVTLNFKYGSNFKYNFNGAGWNSYSEGTTITLNNVGDYVRFSGTGTKFTTGTTGKHFSITGKVACSGNVMSLRLDNDGKSQGLDLNCFRGMFYNCTGLTTAPDLPETDLKAGCYVNMFDGCTSLTTAPELPATTLAESCYNSMFKGCTSLTTAPELPATTLAESCYLSMFIGCTSLTTAPELWATSLAESCYLSMFSGCESLTEAPELPATTLASYCYQNMFRGTKLTEAPELPATTLASYCYSNMFRDCKSLTEAPELPATNLAQYCYGSMFYGCTSLTKAPELPATNLANSCYNNMFYGCTSLTELPALPATTLASNCYSYMFSGCTSLTELPALPATTLAYGCYGYMFAGCSSIKLSETQTAEYSIPYSVPSGGDATPASPTTLKNMFAGTGGTFTGTPEINKTYYVPASTVPVTDLDFEEHYGEVTVGGKTTLTAMIEPDDATDKTVKWSVTQGSDKIKLYEDADCTTEVGEDATDCLTVYVMGVAEGDAVVTVTSNADPTIYAYCDVNVKVPETITIDLNPDNATVIWYDATDSDGYWSMEAAYNDSCYLVLKGNSNQPAGTYEWADMGSGCGIRDYDASQEIYFVDGSCTVTVDEDVVTVSGTFTGRDRNTYVVTVTYEAPYYTITDESVNGAVTAEVNGADVTKAKAGKTVLLNVAPADGYQLKSITASAQKTIPENFSDLVALMGDAVFDGDENYDCGGYTCKVENGKFVVYNGANLLAELSESNMTGFNVDGDYVEVNSEDALWAFYVKNGEITGLDVSDTNDDYIFCADFGSKSTGTLQPVQVDLTTVAEGSQYSFTMPAKNVTVKAEFEEAPAPAKLIAGHSLSLDGNIGINFYLDPSVAGLTVNEVTKDNLNYTFAWADVETTKAKVNVAEQANQKNFRVSEDGKYIIITCYVCAAEMTCDVNATFTLKGKTESKESKTYSVREYCNTVLHPTEEWLNAYKEKYPDGTAKCYRNLEELVEAMLNYGAMAQTKFGINTGTPDSSDTPGTSGKLANEGVTYNPGDVTTAMLEKAIADANPNETADNMNNVAAALGAKWFSTSLIYLDDSTLRHYFVKATDAFNPSAYTDNKSNYYYYVEKTGIPAAELDNLQTFTAGTESFKYSALDFVKGMITSSADEDSKNLAKSLYWYNQAANAYFPAPAPAQKIVDLSTLQGDYEAQDGDVLINALSGDYQITIAAGATVTLRDATITCLTTDAAFAGITPLGDATILLEGENTVKGGHRRMPGIYIPANKTLTIDGTGSLVAYSGGDFSDTYSSNSPASCGIGGKRNVSSGGAAVAGGNLVINGGTITAYGGLGCAGIGSCATNGPTSTNLFGDITINGGTVTASALDNAAGIGSGKATSCGNITITGGTVTATGDGYAAGIGSGWHSNCGDITIAGTVTQVTATKGEGAPNFIGAGKSGSCGTVTIAPGANVIQN